MAERSVDPRTAQQRRVWDEGAEQYERTIGFLDRCLFTGAREWLGERAAGRVLEVAVGSGRNLEHLAGPGRTVVGADLSPRMLEIARRRAAAHGIAPQDLREADAADLPYDDAAFDTVVCSLGLCSIPEPRVALAEMRRVLVPGGRLLLVDHVASTWPPIWLAQRIVEAATIRSAGEHFTRRQLPLVLDLGFEVVERARTRAGTVEKIHARKPVSPGPAR